MNLVSEDKKNRGQGMARLLRADKIGDNGDDAGCEGNSGDKEDLQGFWLVKEEDMRKGLMLICCGIFCLGAGPNCPDQADLEKEARLAAGEFMATLKGRLQEAVEKAGPVHAIQVCSEEAPRIASRISRQRGWEVGRTSLRLRNPANLPEAWERTVLRKFAEEHAAGTEAEKLVYCEVVNLDGERRFRYMKAIPTQKVCLLCHGQEVASDVERQLAKDYPHDRGTGFAVGDLRGAFTIEVPLMSKP